MVVGGGREKAISDILSPRSRIHGHGNVLGRMDGKVAVLSVVTTATFAAQY